jgi:hypothetical protein
MEKEVSGLKILSKYRKNFDLKRATHPFQYSISIENAFSGETRAPIGAAINII